jgi:hypothetical protein
MDVFIKNSEFSSLSFYKDWQTYFDTETCYIQKFAPKEAIRIQFLSSNTGFTAKYVSETETETSIAVNQLTITNPNIYINIFEAVFR